MNLKEGADGYNTSKVQVFILNFFEVTVTKLMNNTGIKITVKVPTYRKNNAL